MAKADLHQKVIDNLRAARNDKGLTHQDVYNDTNIHIGRIEGGKSNVTLQTLIKLCTYYRIEIVDLFR